MLSDIDMIIKPDRLQNVYFTIFAWAIMFAPFLWFFILSIESPPVSVYIVIIIAFFGLVAIFSIYLRHFFRNSVYLTMTPEKVVGYNHFKKLKGEIRWDEIIEMYITKQSWYITIKGKNGKELKTTLPLNDFKTIIYQDENGKEVVEKTNYGNYEIVLNDMIRRAVNCEKIDFRTIKKKFPRILVYEKGL